MKIEIGENLSKTIDNVFDDIGLTIVEIGLGCILISIGVVIVITSLL